MLFLIRARPCTVELVFTKNVVWAGSGAMEPQVKAFTMAFQTSKNSRVFPFENIRKWFYDTLVISLMCVCGLVFFFFFFF